MQTYLSTPSIVLREEGPTLERYSPEQILSDLRGTFPLRPPKLGDSMEELMHEAGVQKVVNWLERYLSR